MRCLLLVLAVAAVMTVMVAANALPAFAVRSQSTPSEQQSKPFTCYGPWDPDKRAYKIGYNVPRAQIGDYQAAGYYCY